MEIELYQNHNQMNLIKVEKIFKNLYNVIIDKKALVAEITKTKIKIYKNHKLEAIIKNNNFNKKYILYVGKEMNLPVLILIKKKLYLPPYCISMNGINNFLTTDIKKIKKMDIYKIKNNKIKQDNQGLFEIVENGYYYTTYRSYGRLSLIQGVALAMIFHKTI